MLCRHVALPWPFFPFLCHVILKSIQQSPDCDSVRQGANWSRIQRHSTESKTDYEHRRQLEKLELRQDADAESA